jgi:hypothetical protein
MHKSQVRSPAEALVYLTDCTLATVNALASKRSAPKGELRRQCAMAQQAIEWMDAFGVDYSGTRATEVSANHQGSVEAWAETFRPQ